MWMTLYLKQRLSKLFYFIALLQRFCHYLPTPKVSNKCKDNYDGDDNQDYADNSKAHHVVVEHSAAPVAQDKPENKCRVDIVGNKQISIQQFSLVIPPVILFQILVIIFQGCILNNLIWRNKILNKIYNKKMEQIS